LNSASGKKIGLNFSRVSLSSFESLKSILKNKKFVDISKNLGEIRRTKTKYEISMIEKSCKIASKIRDEIPEMVDIGMKEKELAAEIDRRMKMYGADGNSFPTIVAAGKNSANSHYTAGDDKIKKGDLIMVDFGCKIRNYCSDITQTFVVGKPSEKQLEMLKTCKKMQDEVVKLLKPGAKIENLQSKANSICEKKYGKMMHMIGHSLGVEVHDPTGEAKELEEGMIITIEPALYLPGFGGVRIEDDFLITKTGYKCLTK